MENSDQEKLEALDETSRQVVLDMQQNIRQLESEQRAKANGESPEVRAPIVEVSAVESDEDRARAMGWKSDPGDLAAGKVFVSATEFLARDALAKEKSNFEREAKELRETVEQLKMKMAMAEEKEKAKVIDDLNKKRIEAAQSGDTDRFLEYDQKYLNEVRGIPQSDKKESNPLWDAFMSKNGNWYNNDPTNKDLVFLAQIADSEVSKLNIPAQEKLDYVENRVRAGFPDRFKVAPKVVAAPNPVEAKTPPPRNNLASYNSLDDNQKTMFAAIKAADPTYTVEAYLNDYNKLNRGR